MKTMSFFIPFTRDKKFNIFLWQLWGVTMHHNVTHDTKDRNENFWKETNTKKQLTSGEGVVSVQPMKEI